jgi:hypothetical protein
MRWHKLHVRFSSYFLSFLVLLKAVACDGLESVAVLPVDVGLKSVEVLPEDVACDGLKSFAVAVRGVEREARAVDVFVDVLDLQRDAIDDRRERIGGLGDLGGMRVDIDFGLREDIPQVERDGLRRVKIERPNGPPL